MRTLNDELKKFGLDLSADEKARAHESIFHLRKKLRKKTCRKCGEEITFSPYEGKVIPHNLDGTPHWQTCPSSPFTQRRNALDILRKVSLYCVVRNNVDLEKDIGLTNFEAHVVQALLERVLKEDTTPSIEASQDDLTIVLEENSKESLNELEVQDENSGLAFQPEPCDPIGDPDEDRAPSEEVIKALDEISLVKE